MRGERIVVVGAGPAGCAAAVQSRRLGAPVLLLDRAGRAGGLVANGFLVENYPGLEAPLPGPAFAARLAAHLDRFDVPVRRGAVEAVEPEGDGWLVRTGRERLRAGAVILATGTAPRDWPVARRGELRGRLFAEVRALLAAVSAPRRVLVVGGGEAAFDYALSLARAGARVDVLVRGVAPRVRGRLAELAGREPGIRVELATRVTALTGSAEGVTAELATPGGTGRRRADAVLAAVGRERSLPALPAGLAGAAPASLEPAPGIYLCGDARCGGVGQAGIAVGDGLAAAMAAAGAVAAAGGAGREGRA
jgi:thioredoxin reductase (NADPH)